MYVFDLGSLWTSIREKTSLAEKSVYRAFFSQLTSPDDKEGCKLAFLQPCHGRKEASKEVRPRIWSVTVPRDSAYASGAWTKEEENRLSEAIKTFGTGDWMAVSNYILFPCCSL